MRFQELANRNLNHDIILHEAGVPPIHTPQAILEKLPNEVYLKKISF